ncbi:MAG: pyridine nucleotide-disulfide oxidoreductase, partial [Novosphingobium sp.]
ERIVEDLESGVAAGGKPGRAAFDALAEQRSLNIVRFRDWQNIDEAEKARARDDAPREKFVHVDHMIEAAKR